MDTKKIQKLEDEIKDLFLNSDSENNWNVFWFVHVKPVIEQVKVMTDKYAADKEVLWLSAIFHDVGYFESVQKHAEIGSEKAYKKLIEEGFTIETAQIVKDVILTHSAREYSPESTEQKILATADAMCHFTTPFYLWLVRINDQHLEETINKIKQKIEKDYTDKIFFEEERKLVEPQYKILKSWFNYSE